MEKGVFQSKLFIRYDALLIRNEQLKKEVTATNCLLKERSKEVAFSIKEPLSSFQTVFQY